MPTTGIAAGRLGRGTRGTSSPTRCWDRGLACSRRRWCAALWLLGTNGLVGLPYVGVFLGHSLVDDGATARGIAWLQPMVMVAAGVSAGALLLAAELWRVRGAEHLDDL